MHMYVCGKSMYFIVFIMHNKRIIYGYSYYYHYTIEQHYKGYLCITRMSTTWVDVILYNSYKFHLFCTTTIILLNETLQVIL